MISRRDLLKGALAGATGFLLGGPALRPAAAMGEASKFRLCILRYEGNWNSRPNAAQTVLSELDARTSVLVSFNPVVLSPEQDQIFHYPFLWMSGDRAMEPLPEQAVANLQRHLRFGGMLFADDTSGKNNSAFAASLRRELERIFPANELEPLPADHAVFRSYYFIGRPAGLAAVSPRLEGITVDDRAAVIFSANDLSGALDLDETGHPRFSMVRQEDRVLAERLAVNLVIYALCVNYKLDLVHVLYQMQHPSRYPGALPPAEGTGNK